MEEGECDALGNDDTEADSVCAELGDVSSSSEASSDAGHASAGDPTEKEQQGTFVEPLDVQRSSKLCAQGHLL